MNAENIPVSRTYLDCMIDMGFIFSSKARFESQSTPVVFVAEVGSKPCNMLALVQSALELDIDILEGVTITGAGVPVDMRNQNRDYPDNALETKVCVGATYTGGTVIRQAQAGFGSVPGQAQAGPLGDTLKLVLKPHQTYAALLTPLAATDFIPELILWEE